jgi:hypothetical protein
LGAVYGAVVHKAESTARIMTIPSAPGMNLQECGLLHW